jgi:uroporphyrinogen-III decarboxylase
MLSDRTGTQSANLPDNWDELTPAQKREYRLNNYLKGEGINFVSPEAKKNFRIRAQRQVDVLNVKEPDRVPVNMPVGSLPAILYGINQRTAMYDYDKSIAACKAFNEKYSAELEYFASPFNIPGRIMDLLDYKLYSWPGHGLPDDAPGFQFMEAEYMRADEYDAFIRDPSDFWLRTYMPRVFGTLEPLKSILPLTGIVENVNINQFTPLSTQQMQDTLHKLIEVGKEYQKINAAREKFGTNGPANGFPVLAGAFCKAPFDTLGDTLRGTTEIMKDMFRRPDKLLKALDVIADFTIANILSAARNSRTVMVTYPLHKGADGWMSEKQFDTFYWPTLKRVMDAFINEGLVQNLFAEGSFNTRLERVNEFPRGTVCWYFDQTDMAKAKKALGDKCSIQGNIPTSLIVTGSPKDVKEYCRKLIETCGKGGGYTLSAGAGAENPKLENLRAIMEAVKEYGVYRK